MTFLYENWYLIVALLCCVLVAGYYICRFFKLPSKDKLLLFTNVLCALVQTAERQLGSGNGQAKLAYVYAEMVKQFPFITSLMTEDTFKMLVDGALYEVGIWVKG